MRHFRPVATPRNRLRVALLLPLLVIARMLALPAVAQAADLFDDPAEIARSVASLKQKIGGSRVRALKVLIAPDTVSIQAQDPGDRRHVDEWRFVRVRFGFFEWERIRGPEPVQLSLINKDLEANLFDLNEVRFDLAGTLIREAIGRAALDDPAAVTGMTIERQLTILPEPSSGPVHWRVDLHSGRESAQIIADARGTIIGQDLSGTNRMRSLDLLRQPEMAAKGAHEFATVLGTGPILLRASLSRTSLFFETNLPTDQAITSRDSIIHQDQAFSWNLNGLRRTLGGSTHVRGPGIGSADAPFGIEEADWTKLPMLVLAAREGLGMPQGALSGIELRKNAEGVGDPAVLWKIEITDRNGEKGSVLADAAGTVKQVLLPESRRKPSNWLDPATAIDAFARIGKEFSADARLVEIVLDDDSVRIGADDPRQPGQLVDVYLSDKGFRRFGSGGFAMAAAMWGKPRTFTIAELAPLTAERIADLAAKTVARMDLPNVQVTTITIGRNNMDPSPEGNITIEIRALVPPFNAPMPPGGRVVYELDGTVIKYYLP